MLSSLICYEISDWSDLLPETDFSPEYTNQISPFKFLASRTFVSHNDLFSINTMVARWLSFESDRLSKFGKKSLKNNERGRNSIKSNLERQTWLTFDLL